MDFGLGINVFTREILRVIESHSYILLLCFTSITTGLLFWGINGRHQLSKFPLVSEKSFWDLSSTRAKEKFRVNARDVVEHGFKKVGASNPFRVISELGEMLILPPSLANEVRNNDDLSFAEYMKEATCAHLPGFEPFLEATKSSLLSDMVKTKLTQSLSKLTQPMCDETASACKDIFLDIPEWHKMILKDGILNLVARLSARVFLGSEEVAHNATWLQITKDYTVDSFIASSELRAYPKVVRPFIHWFLPRAQKVRAQLLEAESIITPVIERRRNDKASFGAERSDSIEWLEELAQEKKFKYEAAALQLNLAISAIHTTTDLLTQTMYELMKAPEIIQSLREEIIAVVSNGGLKHSSLYKLRLMDSVIKEAQRLKPPMSVNMNRVAMANTRLPDGTLIPQGTKLGVSSHALWDPEVYPNPNQFDGYRFLRLREQPGNENAWQLTTTRPEHIAFGHGKHACPGRFLAANEIKIALCHMLLKYEWKLSPSQTDPLIFASGIMLDSDPTVQIMLRRRQSEVEL